MSCGGIIHDVHEIVRKAEQGRAAMQRKQWDTAELAFMEAQDRVARVLCELALRQKSPRLVEPPGPVRGVPD